MTNEQLLAELKVEIGWLRNEMNFTRSAYEQQSRQLDDLRRKVERVESVVSGWSPMVH